MFFSTKKWSPNDTKKLGLLDLPPPFLGQSPKITNFLPLTYLIHLKDGMIVGKTKNDKLALKD